MQHFYLQRLVFSLLLLSILNFPLPVTGSGVFPSGSNNFTYFRLNAPQLQAKPSLVGAIRLTWMPVTGANGYELEVSNTGLPDTFIPLKTFGAADKSYRHTGLYYNQKVYYKIKATGSSGEESAYSTVVNATTHAQDKVFNIMPLGDSNTEGGRGAQSPEVKVSYRAKLAQLLDASASKGKYDFVGSQRSGSNFATDIDHAGFGGATIQNISDLLRDRSYGGTSNSQELTYLQEYQPDIILLHIGTNDADGSDGAITRLEGLLNEVDKYENSSGRDVTVILAKIIKRVCYDDVFVYSTNCYTPAEAQATLIYNSKMEAMAQRRQANGDNLLLVDMQDGAGIIYRWSTDGGDMADPLHPTQVGYDKMAPVWYTELNKLLNVKVMTPPDTEAPETTIASRPATVTNSNTASFSFSSNESGVVYLVSIDGTAFTQVANPYTINNLADGEHKIEVKAKDAAGNIDATPAAYSWTIDTKAPTAPVVQSPVENTLLNSNKPTIAGTAEVNATVTVLNGTTQLGTATADANGNWSFTPATALSEGVQQITAKATDAAGNIGSASSIRRFTIDSKAPETVVATSPAKITNQTTATFTFTSNEDNVKYEVSIDGGTYAEAESPYTLNDLEDGVYTLAVRAADAAGNKDATPETYTWTIDTQAPEAPAFLSITDDKGPETDDQITSDATLIIKGTAEPEAKVQVNKDGNAIGQAAANASGEWVFDYTADELTQGSHTFTATATDAAGNTGQRSASFKVTVDVAAPEVAITTTQESSVKEAFDIEITFTEQVYGLTAADFSLTNATLSNLASINSIAYKATVTPVADGLVAVSLAANKVTDLAGNPNIASDALEITFDGTKPQLSINSEAAAITNKPFTITFTFSEDITGFEAGDVTTVNASLSDFIARNARVYTLLITPVADGEVSIKVNADKAFDAAGNGNEVSNVLERIYDARQPSVVLSTEAAGPVNKPFTVEVEFSEPVTGFILEDVAIENGTASQLSKTGDQIYAILVTPDENGEVRVTITTDKVEDVAKNGNTASNELYLVYDVARPEIVLSTDALSPTNKPFTVSFKLTEPVTDFSLDALSVINAKAGDLEQVSELEYTILITPEGEGSIKVQVPENSMHDVATNGNIASNQLDLQYDATAPDKYKVEFAANLINTTNQEEVVIKVSEAETGATYFYSISSSNGNEEVKGSATVSTGDFMIAGINVSELQDGMLAVSLYLVDEAGNRGEPATDQVEKITRNIVTVEQPASIKVPFKTKFDKLPLPEQVRVTYATQEQENLKVNWQKGGYNGSVPGQYVLTGALELTPKTSNTEDKTASITVEVEPNKAPTALTLSTDSFGPDITPSEAIGTFSTTDPDDSEFTYTLVAGPGDTDNSMFEILNNNTLHLKSNQGLYGKIRFGIRVQSIDTYQNIITKEFILTKSLFNKSKINLVNAFSPDGDGINDTWIVPELKYYNNVEVEVYNRAGLRVFHTLNPEEGWDGRDTDGNITQGSYFYIIQINDLNVMQKGVVTVLK